MSGKEASRVNQGARPVGTGGGAQTTPSGTTAGGQVAVAERLVPPAIGDPIRVVPLYVAAVEEIAAPTPLAGKEFAIPAAPAPRLTYRGGPLLPQVELFTIFWGAAWRQKQLKDLAQKLNDFFDFILTSPLIDQLAEYSVPGQQIGHGTRTGTITVTSPALNATHTPNVSDNAIQHMLQQEIATSTNVPQPTPNTLYFIYMPPGVSVTQGGDRSCQAFCGYHNVTDTVGGARTYYAAMPFPGCSGCTGALQTFDALTSTSSHELCEAITDAIPGRGWYDDHNGEIGDICAWKTKQVGAYTVQLEWSNNANSCV